MVKETRRMNDNKFTTGMLLGLILGGGAVFLLGTRTGKNLLKIISEQGMDGITDLLEEYDLSDLEEVEDIEDEPGEGQSETSENKNGSDESKKSPKKHFFRRIRK
jgi:gas vesicle protein